MEKIKENPDPLKFRYAKNIPTDLSKTDVVFDCEANNLLDKVTKIWCIVAQDFKTKEFYVFSDEWCYDFRCHGSLIDGVKFLVGCRSIIAHNISGYDWFLLNRFYPKIFNKKTCPWKKTHDTLVQSRAQWYDRPARFGIKGNHGLQYYGDLLGYPKPPIEDWTYWDRDKLVRCIVDVEINTRTFIYLNEEKAERAKLGIDFKFQTNIAKYTQYWCTVQELNGMKGNRALMEQHLATLDNEIQLLQDKVEPHLPKKVVVNAVKTTWRDLALKIPELSSIDLPDTVYQDVKRNGEINLTAIKETYEPIIDPYMSPPKREDKIFKWRKKPKKDGSWEYTSALCKLFDLDWEDPKASKFIVEGDFCKVDIDNNYLKYKAGVSDWLGIDQLVHKSNNLVGGMFTRVEFTDTKLTQHAEVKDYLLSLGWQPTEWNRKKDVYGNFMKDTDGSFVKGSPKLTEDSFDSIPEGIGQDIALYNTYMHRRRTLYNDDDDTKGWLNQLDSNDRIRAGANVFATSTGRHSQRGINSNTKAKYLQSL